MQKTFIFFGVVEAINFSNVTHAGWTNGTGSGPWVRADLEDGIWAGNQTTVNELNTPIDAAWPVMSVYA